MQVKALLRPHLTCSCSLQPGVSTSFITLKFLLACTPNGAISYISPPFVGSISDVELTCLSGFLTKLEDKPGVAIMVNKGFTVKDVLQQMNIELNLPPFMEGRQQLPATEVQEGQRIAS